MKKLIRNQEEFLLLEEEDYNQPETYPCVFVYQEIDPDPYPSYWNLVNIVYLSDFSSEDPSVRDQKIIDGVKSNGYGSLLDIVVIVKRFTGWSLTESKNWVEDRKDIFEL